MSIDIKPETERPVREEIASTIRFTPGEAMLKIDGLWVHQGQAEPDADWDGVISSVREQRLSDLVKVSS